MQPAGPVWDIRGNKLALMTLLVEATSPIAFPTPNTHVKIDMLIMVQRSLSYPPYILLL